MNQLALTYVHAHQKMLVDINEKASEISTIVFMRSKPAYYLQHAINLYPQAKLEGKRTNDATRSILPVLADVTDDYADDLLMAIDDLIDVSKCKDESWKKCRIQILIAFKIIHRLKELNQMDLVDSAIGTLQRHISENLKLEKHIQLQIDCEILMLGRSLSTQESPIDCFIRKILDFTESPEKHCEHIY